MSARRAPRLLRSPLLRPLLALAATLAVLIGASTALGQVANLTVTVGSANPEPGATAQVAITLSNIPSTGVAGYVLSVAFDPDVVTVSSVVGGDTPFSGDPTPNIDNANGTVSITAAVATGPTSGSVVIARLNLQAADSPGATTALTLSLTELTGNEGEDYTESATVVHGSVTIAGGAPTATPVPPTATPVPPTATPVPPTPTPAPTPTPGPNEPPTVTAGASRTPFYTHRTWTLQVATFTDPNAGDTHTATITWGDGTVTPGTVNEAAGTVIGSHRYLTPGAYTVRVTVSDNRGGSDEDTFEVTVRPHPRLRR